MLDDEKPAYLDIYLIANEAKNVAVERTCSFQAWSSSRGASPPRACPILVLYAASRPMPRLYRSITLLPLSPQLAS